MLPADKDHQTQYSKGLQHFKKKLYLLVNNSKCFKNFIFTSNIVPTAVKFNINNTPVKNNLTGVH